MFTAKTIIAAILAILAIIMYAGKGDKLIAGYNTASEEERKEVNIKRLRFLVGTTLLAVAAAAFLLLREDNGLSGLLFCAANMIICITAIILANTWAKKK